MIRRGFAVLILAAALCAAILACSSAPKPAPLPPQEAPEASPSLPQQPQPAFDPATVTPEEKEVAITDIRALIESLNRIIQHKDFQAWIGCLTEEYRAYYSRPDVLEELSQYPVIKRMGIKLSSIEDYFLYVVYPSRQNDRVDDIEFIGENRVKAITLSPKGERQILYNLEKHGDTWKIGIGR